MSMKEFEKDVLCFEDAYLDDESIWFSSLYFNSLFQYNLINHKLKWHGFFPGYDVTRGALFSGAVSFENQLFFPPYGAEGISVYDCSKGEFRSISMNTYGTKCPKIYGMTVHEEYLYMFGAQIPAIIKLNMRTNDIEYDERIHKEIQAREQIANSYYVAKSIVRIGKKCILASRNSNLLFEIDLENGEYSATVIEEITRGIITISKLNDEIIVVPANDDFWVAIDYSDGKKRILPKAEKGVYNAVSWNCSFEGRNYFFPLLGTKVLSVDDIESSVKEAETEFPFCNIETSNDDITKYIGQKVTWVGVREKTLFYFSSMNRKLYAFKDGRVEEIGEIKADKSLVEYIEAKRSISFSSDSSTFYVENQSSDLKKYITVLSWE